MNPNNLVTQLLQISYPLVQAPMLVVTTAEMVAKASDAGCLGSLPLGYSDIQKATDKIRAVKQLTNKPFAVNLFAYEKPGKTQDLNTDVLRSYYEKYSLPFYDSIPSADPYTYYTDLVDVIVEERVPVVSFHFGVPDRSTVDRLKSNAVVLIATATCVEEAKIIEASGVDIIVAQGIEAGGNRGTFVEGELPQISLVSLVPQIVDAVHIPVIAAGGIMDARGIRAAFALGAQGVQMGSIFLRSDESGAPKSWKSAVAASGDQSTVVTNVWSGRYGRCINNQFVREMQNQQIFPSPIQHYLTSKLRDAGRQKDIAEIQSLWAGQSARYAQEKSTRDILTELIEATCKNE